MDWLSGNWIWALIAIAGIWFFMRRGGSHGHGMGGHGHSHGSLPDAGHGRDGGGTTAAPGAALDPVSGNAVRTDRALSAVFGDHAYYFESEDTRKRFEAEPQKYALEGPAHAERPRRRRGC